MELVSVIHIFSTVFLCGLCWFVQIVHYPLFKYIDLKDFPHYQSRNYVTGFLTVPIMVVELLTALYLLYVNQTDIWLINLALIIVTGMSTMVYQVPTHIHLKQSPTLALIHKLIRTNWIRTSSWSIRVFLLGYWLLEKS